MFVKAGNVSAVFAGHLHNLGYQQKDGIDYYILGTTGGIIVENSSIKQHLFYWVNVDGSDYHVTGLPLNQTIDPKSGQEKSK